HAGWVHEPRGSLPASAPPSAKWYGNAGLEGFADSCSPAGWGAVHSMRGGSSVGQSSGLIIRRSEVRVLPAPPSDLGHGTSLRGGGGLALRPSALSSW